MRIGVVGKDLHAVIAVNTIQIRPRRAIQKRSRCDRGLHASCAGQHDGVRRRCDASLHVCACFAQVDGVGAHVADFEDPVMAERALHRQVPLLRIGRDEFARHDKAE